MNFAITPRQAASTWYQEALQYELFVGRSTNGNSTVESGINHPEILAYKGRILGRRREICEYADWTEFLLHDYGPRQRCLSLGSGLGRVERYLMRIGFTEGFEAIELCAEENDLLKIDRNRVKMLRGDLNFTELPQDTYDFVLCHGVLHHLINLEFVLSEINKSLKPNGLLLVYEYIGETRWQFARERMNVLRATFPRLKFRVPEPWEVRGFESVRSGDLMKLLGQQFGDACERSVSYGGLYFPFVVCASRPSEEDIRHSVEADSKTLAGGRVPPCYHMGLYRKSARPAAVANPWRDEDLRERLAPKAPVADRLICRLRQSAVGGGLRLAKRAIWRR